MTALREAVDDYLALRRSLGFKLRDYPWYAPRLRCIHGGCGGLHDHRRAGRGLGPLPGPDAHLSYLGKRLCVVRGFARHLKAFDPATEVPSADLLRWQACRAVPYIYSDEDIAALMTAARGAQPEAASGHLPDPDRTVEGDRGAGRES